MIDMDVARGILGAVFLMGVIFGMAVLWLAANLANLWLTRKERDRGPHR